MWSPGRGKALKLAYLRAAGQMDLSPCNGCDACGVRCAAGVQMTREEYAIANRFAADEANTDNIRRVLSQDKSLDLGDGVTVRMCRYRDMEEGGCAIYAARPLVCRLLGHVEWMPCPIGQVPRTVDTPDAVALMQAYASEPRRTFEEWEDSEP